MAREPTVWTSTVLTCWVIVSSALDVKKRASPVHSTAARLEVPPETGEFVDYNVGDHRA